MGFEMNKDSDNQIDLIVWVSFILYARGLKSQFLDV